MLCGKLFAKSHITTEDVTNVYSIFSPDLTRLQEKTVHRKLERVMIDNMSIPQNFTKVDKFVTLAMDEVFLTATHFLLYVAM